MIRDDAHIAHRYAVAVLRRQITAGRLIRLACKRHIRDLRRAHERGLFFDEAEADKAIRFYSLIRHTKGPKAGQPFLLEPWQAWVVGSVYGWMRVEPEPGGELVRLPRHATRADIDAMGLSGRVVRRFNEVYEEVARKNGKSAKLAPLGLKSLVFDGEAAAEVYSAATKREQARIVFTEALRMLRSGPLKRVYQAGEHKIAHRQSGSEFIALSRDAHSMDGLNPYFVMVDELHAHRDRAVVDVLESAMGARRNQLIWYITTAGARNAVHSICWEKRTYAVMVLEGAVENDTLFAAIYSIDEGDDWSDERVWIKANPNLGVSISIERLRDERDKALARPGQQAEFRRKRCNEWVETESAWLSPDAIRRCPDDFDPFVALEAEAFDEPPYWGFDLSSTVDITAMVLVWPPREGETRWRTISRYFVPEAKIAERVEKDRLPYDQWRDEGKLIVTPGDMIDQDAILAEALRLREAFGVRAVGYDRWNATQFASRLMAEGFENVQEVRQGILSFGHAAKVFEALIAGGHLHWDGNPVTFWMFVSATLRRDANNNFMPDKGKAEHSRSKIDGLVALLMAMAIALRDAEDQRELEYQPGSLLL